MISKLIRRHGWRKLACLMLDLISFAVGGYCALTIVGRATPVEDVLHKTALLSVSGLLTIFAFRYYGLYKQRVLNSTLRQLIPLLKSSIFTFLTVLVLYFLFRPVELQMQYRLYVLSFVLISYIIAAIGRFVILRSIIRRVGSSDSSLKNAIAVGAGNLGAITARKLMLNRELGYNLVGFVDDNQKLRNRAVEGIEVLGVTDELNEVVARLDVEEIFVTINEINHEDLFDIIQKCKLSGCPINVVSDHFHVVEKKMNKGEFDELQFVTMFPRENSFYKTTTKPIMDVIFAGILLILLSPMFLLLAMAIKLTSKGPVLYVPLSIGKNGQPFRFYKFRSMLHNAPDDSHRELIEQFISGKKQDGTKLQNDPRITPIGRLIRKFSLDEFAQLINVLKRDMSLVGPRPSTQYEYDMMENWHKRRYDILPGMTGLWQVSGRSEVSFKDMILMDIYYVENCSFWLDFEILLKTFKVVLFGKGGQ